VRGHRRGDQPWNTDCRHGSQHPREHIDIVKRMGLLGAITLSLRETCHVLSCTHHESRALPPARYELNATVADESLIFANIATARRANLTSASRLAGTRGRMNEHVTPFPANSPEVFAMPPHVVAASLRLAMLAEGPFFADCNERLMDGGSLSFPRQGGNCKGSHNRCRCVDSVSQPVEPA
jgi:hypothetical protein